MSGNEVFEQIIASPDMRQLEDSTPALSAAYLASRREDFDTARDNLANMPAVSHSSRLDLTRRMMLAALDLQKTDRITPEEFASTQEEFIALNTATTALGKATDNLP